MNIKEEKRQVSFRLTGDEWDLFNLMYHEYCLNMGKFMPKVRFIKSRIFNLEGG